MNTEKSLRTPFQTQVLIKPFRTTAISVENADT